MGSRSAAEATDIGAVRELCDMAGGIGKKIFTRDLSKLFVDHPAEKHVMVDDEQVATLQWIARGPAVVICPSNGPVLSSLVQAGMAMQAGCPIIIKPSPWSPHSFNVVADALTAADLPSGLVQIVQGSAHVGRTLVESPLTKTVCFTGAVAAGLKVAETCARSLKPYVLELGGSNPFVVMADADLDAAASALLEGLITVNGTYCCGPGRVFVHAEVHNPFLDIVGNKMKDI
ncbi:hypothetical protein HKX48_002288 [Thoreauomyces humboldtii]|nr:hypothetical protein HKX48_002288 [Thoreauomyces humboldtii]